jgi:hypothetical protein
MKALLTLCVAVALVACGSLALAGDIKSGLEPGAPIGAFDVTKCSGAADDGVKVGAQLCYRCKYGTRPMVMVFTRGVNDQVVKLAKDLDKAVAANEEKQFKAFVNLLGSDREALEASAKDLGTKNELKNVPVVVPIEFENGPDNYGINPKADVTVLVAKGGKVVSNHAFDKGELNAGAIQKILAEVPKLVAE